MGTRGIDLLDDLLDLPEAPEDMNEALTAWAAEHAAEATPAETERPLRGPCAMCTNPATARCLRCARPACIRHQNIMVGLCTHCTEERDAEDQAARATRDPYADERPPRGAELDLDWIE